MQKSLNYKALKFCKLKCIQIERLLKNKMLINMYQFHETCKTLILDVYIKISFSGPLNSSNGFNMTSRLYNDIK